MPPSAPGHFGPLTDFFTSLGVESVADLASFFDSEDDARSFAAAKGQSADAVVLAWAEAKHRSRRALANIVVGTSSTTPSSLPTCPVVSTPSSIPAAVAGEISAASLVRCLFASLASLQIDFDGVHSRHVLRQV